MKIVRFESQDDSGYGVVTPAGIVPVGQATGPDTFVAALIAARQVSVSGAGDALPLDAVRLRPIVPDSAKILCVATNFREDKPAPDYPLTFTRFADSLVGHGEDLLKPAVSDRYDFEGELAVVIGKAGHRISRQSALDHIAGYVCFNDGSVRDWQKHSSQFIPGKNFHRSGSMGPWLVTPDEAGPFADIRLQTRVNGVVKQEIGMDRMIFDVSWLISYFSTFTPLSPGDVIATGTPSGFGSTRVPPEFLSDGDVVEIEISGVGTLHNTVRTAAG